MKSRKKGRTINNGASFLTALEKWIFLFLSFFSLGEPRNKCDAIVFDIIAVVIVREDGQRKSIYWTVRPSVRPRVFSNNSVNLLVVPSSFPPLFFFFCRTHWGEWTTLAFSLFHLSRSPCVFLGSSTVTGYFISLLIYLFIYFVARNGSNHFGFALLLLTASRRSVNQALPLTWRRLLLYLSRVAARSSFRLPFLPRQWRRHGTMLPPVLMFLSLFVAIAETAA